MDDPLPASTPHPDEPPLLTLDGVTFGYGRDPVVRGISAAVRPGAVTVLLGPNAAGKTTLLRLMMGQLPLLPGGGAIELLGAPLHQWSATRRAAVMSFVPQRASVAFAFTVRQVVTMGRHALPHDPDAVEAALEQTETATLADRPVNELSVGQQQRVVLARALAQSAGQGRVMLLDEPASAMDPLHAHRVMTLLRQQARRGLGVVVVLHDLNLACRYADDAWLLHEGGLAAAGPWDRVLTEDRLGTVYRLPFRVAGRTAQGRPVWNAESPPAGVS